MHQLFRKNQYFYWNQKHQEAFHSVNQSLTDAPTLALPNEGGRYVLDMGIPVQFQ